MNELQKCLQYCQEQNGLSDCKNCGLSKEMIDEYKKEIINECVEIVKRTLAKDIRTLKNSGGYTYSEMEKIYQEGYIDCKTDVVKLLTNK